MTTYAVNAGYFDSTENDENCGTAKLRVKDAEVREMKMNVQGNRTVLGSLTNKPLANVAVKSKQDENCDPRSMVTDEQMSKARVMAPVQQTFQSFSRHSASSQKPIDLSCHEMDVSVDCASTSVDHQCIDEDMADSQDSVILLDTMSSDEDTLEDGNAAEHTEAKERTDRLMSMAEYHDEIYEYLRKSELYNRPRANYMQRQADITSNMRTILVDWLIEVADEYRLHRETLFLAVNFVDRFLSVMAVQRSKLQLVGTAAMFIAAKYEEIYPPDVGEFVYITDDTYTKQQVLRMEHLLLKVLRFDVAVPTTNVFCDRFLKETKADEKTMALAMYLIESSLLDGTMFLPYLPSVTAASAICLANLMLGSADPWPSSLVQATQYAITDLEACLRDLIIMVKYMPSLQQQAVREKYKTTKYHEVSLIQPSQALCEQWTHSLTTVDMLGDLNNSSSVLIARSQSMT